MQKLVSDHQTTVILIIELRLNMVLLLLGLTVTCTAVERPDVNIGKVRSLAQSLGAQNFQSYSFHR